MTTAPAPGTPPEPSGTADGVPGFREQLWPGPLGWVAVVAFAVVLGIAFVPVDTRLALAAGLLALGAGLAGAVLTTPLVRVAQGTLQAGSARIPVDVLAAPRVLDRAALRTELGPALDARAYVCLRSWIGTAVRVEVVDPQDPTPYWIVSTRRPDLLVAALLASGAQPVQTPGTTPAGHPEG
ncbi:DUF3093 domain-containing protein [Cellulomonas sp. zg-ZUI222]|uniref:DUF3093 domain-containing protein n=1 Tax=Cellulomonas wangleii TaxID=2816956 RepID=UPI001A93D067|nr:DUF3093 domain-containing protein [Cellulomonas wangleii]MBO0922659.1 DUF3093 domain-containing protein [Cellulomonas wangleii]